MTIHEIIIGCFGLLFGLYILLRGEVSFSKTGKAFTGGRAYIVGLLFLLQLPTAMAVDFVIVQAGIEYNKAHPIYAALPSIAFIGLPILAVILAVVWSK